MSQVPSQQQQAQHQPSPANDKRSGRDRRSESDRRQARTDWKGEDQRQLEERRAYVGRRQAAAWRHH